MNVRGLLSGLMIIGISITFTIAVNAETTAAHSQKSISQKIGAKKKRVVRSKKSKRRQRRITGNKKYRSPIKLSRKARRKMRKMFLTWDQVLRLSEIQRQMYLRKIGQALYNVEKSMNKKTPRYGYLREILDKTLIKNMPEAHATHPGATEAEEAAHGDHSHEDEESTDEVVTTDQTAPTKQAVSTKSIANNQLITVYSFGNENPLQCSPEGADACLFAGHLSCRIGGSCKIPHQASAYNSSTGCDGNQILCNQAVFIGAECVTANSNATANCIKASEKAMSNSSTIDEIVNANENLEEDYNDAKSAYMSVCTNSKALSIKDTLDTCEITSRELLALKNMLCEANQVIASSGTQSLCPNYESDAIEINAENCKGEKRSVRLSAFNVASEYLHFASGINSRSMLVRIPSQGGFVLESSSDLNVKKLLSCDSSGFSEEDLKEMANALAKNNCETHSMGNPANEETLEE